MNSAILQDRLAQYQPRDKLEELRAVKEIAQEIALAGLCRAGLFEQASFQGGTCLRIVHRLSRFSEDLDFALHNADATFHWPCLFRELEEEFRSFGLHLEASDRSQANQAVKKAFLKEDSFGQVLKLNFPRLRSDPQKVLIKLEVDTNPPSHCTSQISYIDFPYPFSVTCHDLSSLFAGKCHALLCRGFVKGRDWFDFLWYVSRETVPNWAFLSSALDQTGPWKGSGIAVDSQWLVERLRSRIHEIEWKGAAEDLYALVPREVQAGLKSWSCPLFLSYCDRMLSYL